MTAQKVASAPVHRLVDLAIQNLVRGRTEPFAFEPIGLQWIKDELEGEEGGAVGVKAGVMALVSFCRHLEVERKSPQAASQLLAVCAGALPQLDGARKALHQKIDGERERGRKLEEFTDPRARRPGAPPLPKF